eukprot:m.666567 g.666567  ORF g.666567 m.666567 type:complete len:186 (+) comp22750_c0_seq2:220-777(+)
MGCCGSKEEDEQDKREHSERTPLLGGGNRSIQDQAQPDEYDASEGRAPLQPQFISTEPTIPTATKDKDRDLADELRDLTIRTEGKLIMTMDDRDGELCWVGHQQRLKEYRQWLDALDMRSVKLNTPESIVAMDCDDSTAEVLSQPIQHVLPDVLKACTELHAVSDLAGNFVFSEPVIMELDDTLK